jgi:hypothetical protein
MSIIVLANGIRHFDKICSPYYLTKPIPEYLISEIRNASSPFSTNVETQTGRPGAGAAEDKLFPLQRLPVPVLARFLLDQSG